MQQSPISNNYFCPLLLSTFLPNLPRRRIAFDSSIMATTMVLPVGEDEKNTMVQSEANTSSNSSNSTKNRPNPLNLSPFDPNELSHKLSAVAVDKEDDSASSIVSGSQDSPKDDPSKSATLSPKTALKQSPAKSPKSPKSRQSSISSRRSSIFGHFSIKGSNYDPKKDDDKISKPAPYRHVPKTAAAQFAKTTTIEPLTDKAVVTKQMKSPGPAPATMSLQDYNRQYRRTQSLSHGRPYDRTSAPFTVLESTAEVDEDSNQPSNKQFLQPHSQNFDPANEATRRMSTGNMRARSDVQRGVVDVPLHSDPRKDSTNLSVYRAGSVSSLGGNPSPWTQGSAGNSPFNRVDFDSRRSSEASGPSRRSSVGPSGNTQRATVVDMYRVDWTESDQTGRRRDSRWSIMRGRIGSKERRESGSVSGDSNPPTSPTSPKTGFLGRFKR